MHNTVCRPLCSCAPQAKLSACTTCPSLDFDLQYSMAIQYIPNSSVDFFGSSVPGPVHEVSLDRYTSVSGPVHHRVPCTGGRTPLLPELGLLSVSVTSSAQLIACFKFDQAKLYIASPYSQIEVFMPRESRQFKNRSSKTIQLYCMYYG